MNTLIVYYIYLHWITSFTSSGFQHQMTMKWELQRCPLFFCHSADRAEKHDFWPRLWLFYFISHQKKRQEKKRIKSHAFLLDHSDLSYNLRSLWYFFSNKSFLFLFVQQKLGSINSNYQGQRVSLKNAIPVRLNHKTLPNLGLAKPYL